MKKKVSAPVRIDFGGGTTDISPFRDKYGGFVLNAAINKRIYGELTGTNDSVGLKYHGEIPTSSGLGPSGVMSLVWLALISKEKNKEKLVEQVYKIEQSMGQVGGKQDQYSAAFGGINLFEFKGDKVNVKKLNLSRDFIKELENHLVLVYTGKPHFATDSNKSMIDNLRMGKNVKNLLRIKKIAFDMKDALLKRDLHGFAKLMNDETYERIKLHKGIAPIFIKRFIDKGMKSGAIAAKICGSGGGGSILFFGDKNKLKEKFGNKVIDFKFDFEGLKWS